MDVRIEELTPATEPLYFDLLARVPTSLLYHSLNYRNFLRQILPHARDRYLLAFRGEEAVAALPTFVAEGPLGPVVNSLPFYGSNGSIVATNEQDQSVHRALLTACDQLCRSERAATSTIVLNPLSENQSLVEMHGPDMVDERIGQMTPLPRSECDTTLEEQLMASFHSKTRNMVRKGQKSGFTVAHDGSAETMRRLHEMHELNMSAIGGLAKPWDVFQSVIQNFEYDRDYRVYTACKNGVVASALLVFFFNKTAEYFTPATLEQYRSEQPLSVLILEAMKDAVAKGCSWWNWGGTWLSQDGVYLFKSRWGTRDLPYKYLTKIYAAPDVVRTQRKSDLLAGYPYFFVLPFSSLVTNAA